jgi:cytochrome c oxidase cbb3-type subunit 3
MRTTRQISPDKSRIAKAGCGGPLVAALLVLWFGATAPGCKREDRGFRVTTPSAARAQGVRLTPLQAGPASPDAPAKSAYEENAYAMSEGQRLFTAFNCSGCHGNGGGGMGPALLDEKWRYGSDPHQIYATIMEGRPNGMPSFRGKLPDHQAWQLAAYVRSLSGLVAQTAAPGRNDHMKNSPPGNSVDPVPQVKGERAPSPN